MTNYALHTVETAPDEAQVPLRALREAFGVIPGVAALMANTPLLLNSFYAAFGQFRGDGTFTPAERQVLLLSNAVANDSTWAVAFHSVEALHDGVPADAVAAIRRREVPSDPRLAALSVLTRALIEKRGHLDENDAKTFTAAGFDDDQILEVVTGVAISTMTNYAANLAQLPVEAAFAAQTWEG